MGPKGVGSGVGSIGSFHAAFTDNALILLINEGSVGSVGNFQLANEARPSHTRAYICLHSLHFRKKDNKNKGFAVKAAGVGSLPAYTLPSPALAISIT
jgi:hypothetical protein